MQMCACAHMQQMVMVIHLCNEPAVHHHARSCLIFLPSHVFSLCRVCRSPFPTTGTPLHTIKEESGSPAPVPKQSRAITVSPDEHSPLRVLPFMRSPGDQEGTGLDEDEMYHQTLRGELLQRTPPVS